MRIANTPHHDMNDTHSFERLQDDIHYQFRNTGLLMEALTHSSYANEKGTPLQNNERLEFLGDAVLELCVSAELYNRFSHAREGHLTNLRARLVSAPALARTAKRLHLDRHILLGKGEESQGGRDRNSVLSDCLEALLGAIFLDGGFDAVRKSTIEIFGPVWPNSISPYSQRDYKSRLQELTQKIHQERPRYIMAHCTGPEHDKSYSIEVHLPDTSVFTANASSIKKAEQKAARIALEHLTRTT